MHPFFSNHFFEVSVFTLCLVPAVLFGLSASVTFITLFILILVQLGFLADILVPMFSFSSVCASSSVLSQLFDCKDWLVRGYMVVFSCPGLFLLFPKPQRLDYP